MMRARDVQRAWTELPLVDIESIFGRGRTLILAPHPDDESLGCGGLIAELCRIGRPPLVVVVTDGTGSHPNSRRVGASALRRLRERETDDALWRLGLTDPAARVFMRLPDTAAPHEGQQFDIAVRCIAALAAECETICAPWGHDPHCDHEAAHLMARAVAAQTGIRHLAYPVWGWTIAGNTTVPATEIHGWRLNIMRAVPAKKSAIAAHRSQHGDVIDGAGGFTLPPALLDACQRPYRSVPDSVSVGQQSRDAAYFDRIYAASDDPWHFRSSPYEREKYAATLAALPQRQFRAGLEIGCSIGELTRLLAQRCDALCGMDIAAAALAIARARCADLPHVGFVRANVPRDWPIGHYDLIVLSEVLYFFSHDDRATVARLVCRSLTKDGVVLLVNWLGHAENPCGGDEAAEGFAAAAAPDLRFDVQQRHEFYRIDRMRRP